MTDTDQTCRHCGDYIEIGDNGKWWGEGDDVCGTDLRRDHQPVSAQIGNTRVDDEHRQD